jgi:4-methylaminobutanoate oxidase (formaldehyde-forming)
MLEGNEAPMLYHEEPIWRDGKIIGSITSGGYGHSIGASLGMGYVRCEDGVTQDWLAAEPLEIEVAWKRYPARAQFAPWYDPKGERIKS